MHWRTMFSLEAFKKIKAKKIMFNDLEEEEERANKLITKGEGCKISEKELAANKKKEMSFAKEKNL